MLNLILGRAGYGKTDYCFSKITSLAKGGNKDILLLTPEQYNFTAEKNFSMLLEKAELITFRICLLHAFPMS